MRLCVASDNLQNPWYMQQTQQYVNSRLRYIVLNCCGLDLKCPRWPVCVEGLVLSFVVLGGGRTLSREGSMLGQWRHAPAGDTRALAPPAFSSLLGHSEVR